MNSVPIIGRPVLMNELIKAARTVLMEALAYNKIEWSSLSKLEEVIIECESHQLMKTMPYDIESDSNIGPEACDSMQIS